MRRRRFRYDWPCSPTVMSGLFCAADFVAIACSGIGAYFFIAWLSYSGSTSANVVAARRFGADGLPLGDEFQVSQSSSYHGSLTVGTCTSGASQTAGNGATYTYVLQTDINLSNQKTLGTSIVERRLLVIGAAYQRYRRILVTYRMNTSLSSPLFERYRYVECSATNDTSVNIAGNFNGCADPGA